MVGTFAQLATAPARNGTGSVTFVDKTVSLANTYAYRVTAVNAAGQSAYTGTVTVLVAIPGAPTINTATAVRQANGEVITVTWTAVPGANGYTIQWSATAAFTTVAGTGTVGNVTTYNTVRIARQVWYVRVIATNVLGQSQPSPVKTVAAAP